MHRFHYVFLVLVVRQTAAWFSCAEMLFLTKREACQVSRRQGLQPQHLLRVVVQQAGPSTPLCHRDLSFTLQKASSHTPTVGQGWQHSRIPYSKRKALVPLTPDSSTQDTPTALKELSSSVGIAGQICPATAIFLHSTALPARISSVTRHMPSYDGNCATEASP